MDYKELSINERVNYLRKHEFDMTMEDFGQRIQMTKGAISYMEKGNRVVSERTIKIICAEFNVNEHWLRTGEGEMFIEMDSTIIEELAKEYKLDDLEKKIVEHFVKLDSKHREAIKDYVLSLAVEIGNASETAATVEDDIEAEVEKELDILRQELIDEKKAKMSSASQKRDETG